MSVVDLRTQPTRLLLTWCTSSIIINNFDIEIKNNSLVINYRRLFKATADLDVILCNGAISEPESDDASKDEHGIYCHHQKHCCTYTSAEKCRLG